MVTNLAWAWAIGELIQTTPAKRDSNHSSRRRHEPCQGKKVNQKKTRRGNPQRSSLLFFFFFVFYSASFLHHNTPSLLNLGFHFSDSIHDMKAVWSPETILCLNWTEFGSELPESKGEKMYQWRKFEFFEEKFAGKCSVPEEVSGKIECCSSGRGKVVVGCEDGTVSFLDRGLKFNHGFQAHTSSVLFLQQLKVFAILYSCFFGCSVLERHCV